MRNDVKFFSLADNALTIELGSVISENLNRRAIKLSNYFEQNKFPGLIETVPAYASVTIFFNILSVRRAFPEFTTAFDAVKKLAENALENLKNIPEKAPRLIEIPVSFDAEFALDLEFVAKENDLKTREVIEIFTAKTYRVYMLGFLPGFSYMGEVDASIATPRRQTPRLKVPKGSVGIAGRQTGIYSLESPGGWQIIGKTDVGLFTPEAENPCFLQPGDTVKFYERTNS
jgi:inhibitor of KinA